MLSNGRRPRTEAEIRDDARVRIAKKVKEALKDPELHPYSEPEDEADPDIVEEEVLAELEGNDYLGKPQAEREEIRVRKLEEYLAVHANHFPIDVFPEQVRRHILDAEESLNFPKEFYAAGILSTVAGAIRNNFQLQFKDGLVSIASLYLMIVGRSGLNKSSPLERALKPLMDKELAYDIEYKQKQAIYKKHKEEGIKDATEPTCQRCLINDATMEATLEILAENPLGLTLYYDEFMGFLKSMDKYRSGDDVQKWLSIWSGKMIRLDRKKQDSVLIGMPFMNNVGTIQTDVLIKFIHSFKENNGFIDRMLYAIPATETPKGWNRKMPNQELERQYHQLIKNITNVGTEYNSNGGVIARMFHLSPDAFTRILEWQNENAELSDDTDNPQIAGIYKKLEVYALRFTLIMAVLDYANKCPSLLQSKNAKLVATEQHVNAAIKITEYFRNTARRIMEFVSQKVAVKHYSDSFMTFFDALPPAFNTRIAMSIGRKQRLSERTVYNYLKFDMIKNVSRGEYEKRYYRK